MFIFFDTTCFITKYISSSIYLILAWRIRLWESNMTLKLSERIVGDLKETCNSLCSDSSKSNLDVACVKSWYSTLTLDCAIWDHFLKLEQINFKPLEKKHHPNMIAHAIWHKKWTQRRNEMKSKKLIIPKSNYSRIASKYLYKEM